ncbi:uncharacterized protein LOC115314971 [Ixodes scapularis]|uniref:uncharacterized protein LOC115314971 n=1 Tax=Ixodes scapularis TaxID=6945 RepID=UPI001A9DA804|nr:uncharacterized protein LOC115314971 [Ixodes scapularis]
MPVPTLKSRNNCCVVGCNSTYKNSPDTKFYGFPAKSYETERRAVWTRLVRRCNADGTTWTPTPNSKICSKHFLGNEKRNEEAHPSYNPSIFPSPYKKRVVLGVAERHDRQLKRVEQQRRVTPCTAAPEVDLPMERQPAEEPAPAPLTASASTMTEDDGASFSPCTLFLCCNMGGDVSTLVCHKTVVDEGCGPDTVSVCDRGAGPVYKEPFFTGYKSVCDDEAMLTRLSSASFSLFALLLSLFPDTSRRQNELSSENRLLLFLIKLKHNVPFSCLGILFSIHRTTAARIFRVTLEILCARTRDWIWWPRRGAVQATMPPSFKVHYPLCRVIIDCTEMRVEMPPSVEKQNLWYSQYKGCYTVKYLIGVAPSGLVTFLSDGFGGRTTDTAITIESGFLHKLQPDDVVLADKGFPGIITGVGAKKATLVMPPFASGVQFTEVEVDSTYETASVRIHVERVIQRVKIYTITQRVSHHLIPHLDNIMHILCVLTNLRPGIFRPR